MNTTKKKDEMNYNCIQKKVLIIGNCTMKKIIVLISFVISFSLSAQSIICSRTAPLENDGYTITGTATLEKVGNENIKLKLSSDYTTPSGPDVRIYLSKLESFSSNSTLEIVNLAVKGDFSGEKTFNVPSGVNMDDYPYILFHCLRFNASWAKGTWSSIEGSCSPTSIWNQNVKKETRIFPNPTQGVLNFENTMENVSVYTIHGTQVLQYYAVNRISLSGLTSNTYIIVYDGNRKIITLK